MRQSEDPTRGKFDKASGYKALFEGHAYTKQRDLVDGVTSSWYCDQRKTKGSIKIRNPRWRGHEEDLFSLSAKMRFWVLTPGDSNYIFSYILHTDFSFL